MGLLVFCVLLPLSASASQRVLYVKHHNVECEAVVKMQCMLVKKAEGDEWELFYDGIKGFEYESGYTYTLLVEIREIAEPMADGSSIEYRLIKLVDKHKVKP